MAEESTPPQSEICVQKVPFMPYWVVLVDGEAVFINGVRHFITGEEAQAAAYSLRPSATSE